MITTLLVPRNIKTPVRFSRRKRSSSSEDDFVENLSTAPWSLVSTFDSLDDQWATWKSIFLDILDRHFPLKAILCRRKPSLPWISKDIIDLIRQRDFCRKASISRRKSSEERLIFAGLYRKLRNTITYRLRAAKSKFFTEKLCSYKSSPRLFWKSINDITGRVRIASGQLPSVDALNRQFNSVVGTSSSNVTSVSCSVSLNAPDCSTTAGSSFFNFPFFSVEEVCSLLEHLNTNKASGSDGSMLFISSLVRKPLHHRYLAFSIGH